TINIDVTGKNSTVQIDGNTPIPQTWTSGITQFAVVEFRLTTPDTSGQANLDTILLTNPDVTRRTWLPSSIGNWTDGANWSGGIAQVTGDAAFIEQAGTYTVQGPPTGISLYVLAIASSSGAAELKLNQNMAVTGLNSAPGSLITIPAGTS